MLDKIRLWVRGGYEQRYQDYIGCTVVTNHRFCFSGLGVARVSQMVTARTPNFKC